MRPQQGLPDYLSLKIQTLFPAASRCRGGCTRTAFPSPICTQGQVFKVPKHPLKMNVKVVPCCIRLRSHFVPKSQAALHPSHPSGRLPPGYGSCRQRGGQLTAFFHPRPSPRFPRCRCGRAATKGFSALWPPWALGYKTHFP